jgi:hypothetical protein
MVFYDRPVYQEEHAAQLLMARRLCSPPKADYICADLSIALLCSLLFCLPATLCSKRIWSISS